MNDDSKLDSAFEFYLENQSKFVEQYDGKFIVIKDDEVVGVYEDEIDAVIESEKTYPKGSFLVQHVSQGKDEYTEVFHSRVAFN
jgi:hypothetical protein